MTIPDNLGQTEVGDLNPPNTTRPNSWYEFTFIHLFFITRLGGFGVLAGNKLYGIKEEILWFDITAWELALDYLINSMIKERTGGQRPRSRAGTQWPLPPGE